MAGLVKRIKEEMLDTPSPAKKQRAETIASVKYEESSEESSADSSPEESADHCPSEGPAYVISVKSSPELSEEKPIGDTLVFFGKYAGKTYSWVAETVPDYCDFVIKCKEPSANVLELRNYLLTLPQYARGSVPKRESMNSIMGFGRHSHETYGWVIKHDPQYACWARDFPNASGPLYRFQYYLVSNRIRIPEISMYDFWNADGGYRIPLVISRLMSQL